MKISIIGTGKVGSTLAFSLVVKGLANELVLVNRRLEIAQAEALDLVHAAAFTAEPVQIIAGDYAATENSDLVAICASVPPKPGESLSRTNLAKANAELFAKEIIPQVVRYNPDAVLLVISNPVDSMTYWAWKLSGFPPSRVMGTGTLIDSARYRSLLSAEIGIHPDDIRAYILGEHGDTQFPALSIALTGGQRIDQTARTQQLFEQTVQSGYEIVRRKGYTNYAIALASTLIIESVGHDLRRTIPVSTLVDGYQGVRDVCLSVPAIIGRAGVLRQLQPKLSEEEGEAFRRSAEAVRKTTATFLPSTE